MSNEQAGEFVKRVRPVYIDPVTGEEYPAPPMGLAYEVGRLVATFNNVPAGGLVTQDFTVAAGDWDNDFYPTGISYFISDTAEFNNEDFEGVIIRVIHRDTTPTDFPFCERTISEEPAYFTGSMTYILRGTVLALPTRVPAGDTVRVEVLNGSGVIMNQVVVLVLGVDI